MVLENFSQIRFWRKAFKRSYLGECAGMAFLFTQGSFVGRFIDTHKPVNSDLKSKW
jgi:hypothetical protein